MKKASLHDKVAIIIPTLNRENILCDTIESVLSLDPAPDEIWIIDQTSNHTPATAEYLKSVQSHGVNVIRLPNPGVCFARNLGASLSDADILIYIDDDVKLTSTFVEAHRRNYSNPDIYAILGQILDPHLSCIDTLPKDLANGQVPTNYTKRMENISQIVGANHSIRRLTMLQIGGYDESYEGRTYANEDGDLGLRLASAGFRIDYDPDATLIHLRAPSGGNRIQGRDDFPEWTRSVTFFQYALRYQKGFDLLIRCLKLVRIIALRKENVLKPWWLPWAFIHFIYSFGIALTRHKKGFRSSLFDPGVEYFRRQYLYLNEVTKK